MPSYVYTCEQGHRIERRERMFYSTAVVCDCGGEMHRVPQPFTVNWNGLAPSQGELHPNIRQHIENAPERREQVEAKYENRL